MFAPSKCVGIITATAILHNICMRDGIPIDEADNIEFDDEDNDIVNVDNDRQELNGFAVRADLVNNIFANPV